MESSICENETDSCESIEQIWIKFFSICVCCTSFQSHRLLYCVCLWFLSFISSSCTFHLTNSASAKTQVVCLSSTHLKSSGQHAFFCQVPLLWNCFACVCGFSLSISSSCTFHLLCASAETHLHFISPTLCICQNTSCLSSFHSAQVFWSACLFLSSTFTLEQSALLSLTIFFHGII